MTDLSDFLLVSPGLAITFFFLALNAACKPFCTEGLSRLSALTLIAQFITLYGGVVLIVEDFVKKERIASNEEDNTAGTLSIIYGLVYISNAAVCGWPGIQFLLVTDPIQYTLSAVKRFGSRTETKQENEKDTNPEILSLDPVADHQNADIIKEPAFADFVNIDEDSDFPGQAIHDKSQQSQEHVQPWLGPAVLSNDSNMQSIQQTYTGLASLNSRQNAEHNILAQV